MNGKKRVAKLAIISRPVDVLLVRPSCGGQWTRAKLPRVLAFGREGASFPLLRRIYVSRAGQMLSLHRAMIDFRKHVENRTGRSDFDYATSSGGTGSPVISGPLSDILS